MRISSDTLNDLRDAFAGSDADGDGRISLAEFAQLLDELGAEASPDQARLGFKVIDRNGSGRIDLDEFVQWWRNR
jgi:Ca2+-binding EF-hand superfamily protein